MQVREINDETTALSSAVPIPMVGVLPVNAFLVKGDQPVLVDTGISPERDDFMASLRELIDPPDLRWIVLTHSDNDHVGSLAALLEEAPNARIVTSFITVGIAGVGPVPIPPERALMVRDGSTVELGDRTFTARRPPLFDNPGTLGFYDAKQDVLFGADCFGAPFSSPDGALADDVASTPAAEVMAGQLVWGAVDSPWALFTDEAGMRARFEQFVADDPSLVLSAHLPPIRADLARHVESLTKLPSAAPFVSPDQAAFEAFMAEMGGPPQ